MSLKNILVVDDEEDLTWSISKHLSKDKERYNLFAVNSAADALDILKKKSIELVISDIRMPEISGLDLLMKIRENYSNTKVIIMTAYGSSEIQKEANKRGCFKYIEKPFEINDLRNMILSAVEEKKGFEGRISDFHLSDLIQMNCLGRLTNALQVTNADKNGTIFFEDGNIVHAEVGDIVGEDAFYEIISWEGGSFNINRGFKAEKDTILKGWQSLLLEGLRRMDENSKKTEEVAGAKKDNKVREILEKLINTKGIHLLILFNNKNQPFLDIIHPNYEKKYNLKELKAVVNSLLEVEANISKQITMKNKKELIIEYNDGIMKMTWIPGNKGFLLVIADQTSNFGLLRIETKKYLKSLEKIL